MDTLCTLTELQSTKSISTTDGSAKKVEPLISHFPIIVISSSLLATVLAMALSDSALLFVSHNRSFERIPLQIKDPKIIIKTVPDFAPQVICHNAKAVKHRSQ